MHVHGQAPNYLINLLTCLPERHSGSKIKWWIQRLVLPFTPKTFAARFFIVTGQSLWNNIPSDIRRSKNITLNLRKNSKYLCSQDHMSSNIKVLTLTIKTLLIDTPNHQSQQHISDVPLLLYGMNIQKASELPYLSRLGCVLSCLCE